LRARKAERMEMEEGASGVGEKIKIGVCVMEKKVFSAPMGEILDRLQSFGEFEVPFSLDDQFDTLWFVFL
jgi:hypothetical protein